MAETETIRWYVSRPSLLFGCTCTVLYLCLISPEYCALQQHLLLLLIINDSDHGLGLYCDCQNQLHVYHISTVNE